MLQVLSEMPVASESCSCSLSFLLRPGSPEVFTQGQHAKTEAAESESEEGKEERKLKWQMLLMKCIFFASLALSSFSEHRGLARHWASGAPGLRLCRSHQPS